ncbi:MAG: tetratricopeptide repeat protein [Bacteroidota bacterium]
MMKMILLSIFFCSFLFPQTPDIQNTFRLAQAFEQSAEFERAAQVYETLVRSDSLNYQYFDGLRRTYIQLKRFDDAIALSYSRFRKMPMDISLQANIGSMFSMAGKEAQADSVWNTMLMMPHANQVIYRTVAAEQASQRLFDKAIATYRAGRKYFGDPALFANELSTLYTFMMDYENAVREYVLMLRQNEQQFEFIKSRLVAVVSKDDGLVAALSVISDELHLRESIPLLRIQMWLFMEDNRYADAFAVAKRIEQLIRSNGTEIFQFAQQAFREGAFSVAAQAYQLSLEKGGTPQNTAAAQFGYARCVEELSAAGDSTPASPHGNASESMLETQPTFSGAISLYDSIIEKYPYSTVSVNALFRIGWIRYKQLFDLDGAVAVFDSVLTMNRMSPIAPSVMATIGDIYISQGKLEKAKKQYVAVTASPVSGQEQKNSAQYRLAEIEFFQNDFDSTLALLRPLTENLRADESNDALMLQYFITENRFQFQDALKLFARAELLHRQLKTAEAAQQFSDIVDLYPAAPLADDALMHRADCSIELHRYDDALQTYTRLLGDYASSIERDRTQFKIAELYRMYLNDKSKAIAAYEEILKQYPFSLFTEEARKKIRQLRGDSI